MNVRLIEAQRSWPRTMRAGSRCCSHQNRNNPIQWSAYFLVIFAGLLSSPTFVRTWPSESLRAPRLAGPVDDYVARLESSYRGVKTLRAEFIQTYISGGRTHVESGTVYFARGGRMRWDYREPEEKIFLTDGKKLMLYVPAEKQLTRSPVKSSEDARVPFRLLLSRFNLRRVFGRIEFDAQARKLESGDQVLRTLPKHGDEDGYHEVLMELNSAFDIRRLVIHYADQSTMEFNFNRMERNVQLNLALFQFVPPPGTDVINQAADGN